MPPEDKLDEDCTLLELWSRFHTEIADYRNFQNKDRTIAEYTGALKTIEEALQQPKATQITALDCLDAVRSVATYERDGKVQKYGNPTLGKRLAAIRDIFQFCESRFICADPLWRAPWDFLNRQENNWARTREELIDELRETALREAPKRQYITTPMEQQIVRTAVQNLMGPTGERDGRWVGMLCYLYLGIRPSEGRGLRFRDLRPFGSHPESWYCNICRTATAAGENKAKGKTRNYIRRIPVHPELKAILETYKNVLKTQLACSEDVLDNLPVICVGTDYREPCSAVQLTRFTKRQLSDILTEEELRTLFMLSYADELSKDLNEESAADASANRDLSTQIFRRNWITKAYAETPLEETEIRAIVGHSQHRGQIDYSEETVYSWLQAISHRLICPEYHKGMETVVDLQTKQQVAAGLHTVALGRDTVQEGIRIEITMIGGPAGSDVRIMSQGGIPEGSIVKCEMGYLPRERQKRGDVMTDCSHWAFSNPQNV